MKNCMLLRVIPRKRIKNGCERAGKPADVSSLHMFLVKS